VSDDESWQLLQRAQIGRIASARGGEPDIFPVSYVCDGESIFFRTAADSRLRLEADGKPVAFEAAGQLGAEAWSVVALGNLRTLDESHDQALLNQLPILDFAPDKPYVWMQVTTTSVRGRRFIITPSTN
jgi:nitroimidazol reductase NimA-like FMN-containing flavoprotein (pyridoxamine 5'-phosphate oxidase superfamily)